jgi:hypothetical protein
MAREPKILGPEAPILRLWISFNAEELTKEKTGLPEDLCPLPDTELHPYRSRLIEQAKASERDSILVYNSENLSDSQRQQMEDIADPEIGLYVADYQELKELCDKDHYLEGAKRFWKQNAANYEGKNYMYCKADFIDIARCVISYSYDNVVDYLNQKYQAQIPADKGIITADFDTDHNALTSKSDELTPGLVLHAIGYKRCENNLTGVTEPRSIFFDKVLQRLSKEGYRKNINQGEECYRYFEFESREYMKDISAMLRDKRERDKAAEYLFYTDPIGIGMSQRAATMDLFPYQETEELHSIGSTWRGSMSDEIIDDYRAKNKAVSSLLEQREKEKSSDQSRNI